MKKTKAKFQPRFTKRLINEIARRSFGYVLDCILGYSDSHYTFSTEVEEFYQNFEEDLLEKGITPTDYKVKKIGTAYEAIKNRFEVMVRNSYYHRNKKNKK